MIMDVATRDVCSIDTIFQMMMKPGILITDSTIVSVYQVSVKMATSTSALQFMTYGVISSIFGEKDLALGSL